MLVTTASGISPYDSGRWVINTPAGRHVLVNDGGAELYRILRHASTVEQAREVFNQSFQATLSAEAFDRLVQARFGGYAILQHDGPAVAQPEYIAGATQLLTPRAAGWLALPLVPLMRHRWYWGLLGAQVCFVGVVAAAVPMPTAPAAAYLVAAPLVCASWVVHELGHVAACAAAGVRHGGIGVGLYAYLFPVLYADVSNSWQAPRGVRLRVNAAGIFAQVLLASGLTVGYLATQLPALLLASVSIGVSAAWQLNPFLRSDGYWMLSDLSNTPNLHAAASQSARRAFSLAGFRACLAGRAKRPTRAELLLGVYGVLNRLVLVAVVLWMLSRHGQAIWELPLQLPALVRQAWQLHRWPQPQQLVALGFYAMWARFLVAQLVGRYRSYSLPAQPA
ncbi:zinc metalloprotease [Hymenobacter jeollabukensis]|uniref:M50 family metallopeptidase n=1 Tax=Hymenobacter jeollabukensis TaxID=2025313 RepID=A0A5R8WJ47_9BACT|nr:hypothetical protein [Hymenobacter jeollabukensis]TLM88727.1 hypothetical protein FDY95_23110 [Hymenobacter jeollabukensis]